MFAQSPLIEELAISGSIGALKLVDILRNQTVPIEEKKSNSVYNGSEWMNQHYFVHSDDEIDYSNEM